MLKADVTLLLLLLLLVSGTRLMMNRFSSTVVQVVRNGGPSECRRESTKGTASSGGEVR